MTRVRSTALPIFSARDLEAALVAFSPLKASLPSAALMQPYSVARVTEAFSRLQAPLAQARHQGGQLNPWWIAGLKRDEVRVAQALRGLWSIEFGGTASRDFLARCLLACMAGTDWDSELDGGYRVGSEVSPIGLLSERVDLVVETANHVIGIEIKIDAPLGPKQLERYVGAIESRAGWRHAAGRVVLLAPFASEHPQVSPLSWQDIAQAARGSLKVDVASDGFAARLIASFGEYVDAF